MKARVSAGRRSGLWLSLVVPLSKVAVSGPCGVMHTCKLAPAQQEFRFFCKNFSKFKLPGLHQRKDSPGRQLAEHQHIDPSEQIVVCFLERML